MNRNKRTRNSRKGSPLSVDLRDFLMYSNPSRFAPKVRKNGGAYPQAPTMDQFFSYGASTPPTPFVFQNGGMNDIQRTNMMNAQHYGMMQEGGSSTDFSEGPGNKTADFLRRVKEKAMAAVAKEMDDEAAMYEEEAMNFFQYGGMMQPLPDPSKMNPWMDAYNGANMVDTSKLTNNLLTLADEYADTPTEEYVKKTKFKQVPVAQVGLNFRDQATLPFDYSSTAGPMSRPVSGMMYDPRDGQSEIEYEGIDPVNEGFDRNTRRNAQLFQDTATGDYIYRAPDGTELGRSMDQNIASGYADNYFANQNAPSTSPAANNSVSTSTDTTNAGSPPSTGVDPTAGMTKEQRLEYYRKQRNLPEGTVMLPPAVAGSKQQKDTIIADQKEREADANNRIKPKEPGKLTVSSGASSIVENTINDIKKKREEAEKKKKEEAVENKEEGVSEEEKQKASAAGMTPGEYRTFLVRSTPNYRRALLPGNRLKSMDFYFDTYGPAGNKLTPSAGAPSQENNMTGSGRGLGAFVRGMGRGNNMGENYTQDGSRISDREFKKQSDIPMKSTYDPRGYNNAYSEFRNQNFQNRRRGLGQRIDELYQRQGNLAERYGQGLTQAEANRLSRLENRYNRIGTGRPVPGMLGPSNIEAFSEYTQPEYKAYGGAMGYFAPGGENDIYGTSEYSTDGSDTTELEDYAGNTIYEDAPEGIDGLEDMEFKGRTRMRQKMGRYNPYAAPTALAGLDLLSGVINNAKESRKQKQAYNKLSADQVFTKMPTTSRGDYTVNEGYVRPPQQVPVENTGYNFQSMYAKMGGSYKKGGEYYLTDEEIERLISMGGEVEFLD